MKIFLPQALVKLLLITIIKQAEGCCQAGKLPLKLYEYTDILITDSRKRKWKILKITLEKKSRLIETSSRIYEYFGAWV